MINTKTPISVKELSNAYWEFENKHNLFDLKIKGVFAWEIVRVSLFNQLLKEKVYKTDFHPDSASSSRFDFFILKISNMLQSIKRGALKDQVNPDYIVFESGRRSFNYNGKRVCQYAHFIAQELAKKGTVQLIEKAPFQSDRDEVYIDDFFTPFIVLKNQLSSKLFSKKDKEKITDITRLFNSEFDTSFSISRIITKKWFYFSYQKQQYLKLFKQNKPKAVYGVNAYNNMHITAACKRLKIPFYEIQHGPILDNTNQYHYSHIEPKKPAYFPDHMILWGKFWYKDARLPIPENNIQTKPFGALSFNAKKYNKLSKESKICTFISQAPISQDLFILLKKTAIAAPSYSYYYKLHPSEKVNEIEFKQQLRNEGIKNIEIISSQMEIHHLLKISQYVIGVYSTALFEAIYFDCNIILANLYGVDNLECLYKQLDTPLVNNAQELSHILNHKKTHLINKELFFV